MLMVKSRLTVRNNYLIKASYLEKILMCHLVHYMPLLVIIIMSGRRDNMKLNFVTETTDCAKKPLEVVFLYSRDLRYPCPLSKLILKRSSMILLTWEHIF